MEAPPEAAVTQAPPRPFAFSFGPRFLLFYFDPASREAYPVPGAGQGVFNPFFMDDDGRIAFDQDGRLWAWDLEREQKILFPGTDDLGPVFAPDMDGELMLFHSATDVFLWLRLGWPGPRPTREWPLSPWASPPPGPEAASERESEAGASPITPSGQSPEGSPELSPVSSPAPSPASSPEPAATPSPPWPARTVGAIAPFHSLGIQHGGIFDARIDDAARIIAVVTGDGALWVYRRETGALRQIVAVRALGDGHVRSLDIDLQGRRIAISTDIHLYLIDLYTGIVDPIPFANLAYNSVLFFSPTWITDDEFYYLAQDAAGTIRILLYNWRTEAVRTLTIVNNVLDAEQRLVSDLD